MNAYATKLIAARARTWARAPGSPTMPAMIAGPMMTPAVGPWIPTGSATVRRNRRLPRRSRLPGPAAVIAASTRRASSPLSVRVLDIGRLRCLGGDGCTQQPQAEGDPLDRGDGDGGGERPRDHRRAAGQH